MDVDDFIQRGAAWGIQERAVDDNEDKRMWEDSAAVNFPRYLCKVWQQTVTVECLTCGKRVHPDVVYSLT